MTSCIHLESNVCEMELNGLFQQPYTIGESLFVFNQPCICVSFLFNRSTHTLLFTPKIGQKYISKAFRRMTITPDTCL